MEDIYLKTVLMQFVDLVNNFFLFNYYSETIISFLLSSSLSYDYIIWKKKCFFVNAFSSIASIKTGLSFSLIIPWANISHSDNLILAFFCKITALE